jgi:NAD(P)-dependent dehydrogenase (short-subunit alcohol dehydrogenase family)
LKTIVLGASSGLGRCIGIGLAKKGANVALLARRADLLDDAVAEAGPTSFALPCDVTEPASVRSAIDSATDRLGGLDGLVYATGIGTLARLVDTDAESWQRLFATNVTGAAIVTAAALPHLVESNGVAIYLSSVSASITAPWPGLGAYLVSKAALDKLIEALRGEHPTVGFTRLIVGDTAGGEGPGMTQFANDWDPELAMELGQLWMERALLTGSLLDVEELIDTVDFVLGRSGGTSIPSVAVVPRRPA